jgi:hypothetical protein
MTTTNPKNQIQQELLDSATLSFDSLITLLDSFSNIKFFDKNHTYTIDNEKVKLSVSGAIKKYEKPFDTKKVAGFVARKNNQDIDEVLKEWDYKREYSCHKGSEFHLFVENFLERKRIALDRDAFTSFLVKNSAEYNEKVVASYYTDMALLINNFMNFYDWWKQDRILLKSEFVIGDKASGLCGTIDNLSYNKVTKKLEIFDYKTNKEIKLDNPRGDTLLAPFKHLQNCELVKYSLQLWLYKLIIERNSPFEVDNCYIVWVAGLNNYELFPALNLKEEAEIILNNI